MSDLAWSHDGYTLAAVALDGTLALVQFEVRTLLPLTCAPESLRQAHGRLVASVLQCAVPDVDPLASCGDAGLSALSHVAETQLPRVTGQNSPQAQEQAQLPRVKGQNSPQAQEQAHSQGPNVQLVRAGSELTMQPQAGVGAGVCGQPPGSAAAGSSFHASSSTGPAQLCRVPGQWPCSQRPACSGVGLPLLHRAGQLRACLLLKPSKRRRWAVRPAPSLRCC